jgi:hypothetical protein
MPTKTDRVGRVILIQTVMQQKFECRILKNKGRLLIELLPGLVIEKIVKG